MPLLFSITLFTSAALLFWVQPMVAKMLVPLLGGSPAVWNTSLVFFQAILLAGYAYAHGLTRRCPAGSQRLIHIAIMLTAFLALPVGVSSSLLNHPPWLSNPFLWLFRALFTTVALPFFVLSGSTPLLQSWFSQGEHRGSSDPYPLYAASNLGSLIGLIAYPVVAEPALVLHSQSRLWAIIYGALVLFVAACALVTWRRRPQDPEASVRARRTGAAVAAAHVRESIGWNRRVKWMFIAFVPSSLMLGVTTFVTTDIANVPLLWVVPLSMYLLTFVLAFSGNQAAQMRWLSRVLPFAAIVLAFVTLAKSDELVWLQVSVHLCFFFCAAMVWHTRLASKRPPSENLTDFYFCVAAGGVLGSLFNALLAPLVFRSVLEYPLMILVACAQLFSKGTPDRASRPAGTGRFDFGVLAKLLAGPMGVGLLSVTLVLAVPAIHPDPRVGTMVSFGVPLICCYLLSKIPGVQWPFALGLGAVLAASHVASNARGSTLYRERNFFGTLRVSQDAEHRIRELYHGTTMHGSQFVAPGRQDEPLAYYHRSGPCGQALDAFNAQPGLTNIAVIGLGAGAMVCYAQPGQIWTFYEIDPAVVRLATSGRYFTYLERCTNATLRYVLGDARLRLREAPEGSLDLIVCDAFGSDAPPLHLLDAEAMQLYLSKLSPRGVLLFHISSRYLDYYPVLATLADHFHLRALGSSESTISPEQFREGKLASAWAALARKPEDLGALTANPQWVSLEPRPGIRLWTDDYSDILEIFQWQ